MRAEKFGLSSPNKNPKNNDKPDKETLKRRSERFGLDNDDNEKNKNQGKKSKKIEKEVVDPEKLKSRADRFGVSSLNEKSKKALRKERFGK